jgi:hypothetical protein
MNVIHLHGLLTNTINSIAFPVSEFCNGLSTLQTVLVKNTKAKR